MARHYLLGLIGLVVLTGCSMDDDRQSTEPSNVDASQASASSSVTNMSDGDRASQCAAIARQAAEAAADATLESEEHEACMTFVDGAEDLTFYVIKWPNNWCAITTKRPHGRHTLLSTTGRCTSAQSNLRGYVSRGTCSRNSRTSCPPY